MSMGDDVASATMQVSMKAAEAAIDTVSKTVDRTIDNIAKLLQVLAANRGGGRSKKDVKGTDLTDIKSGEVKMKDLLANARKLGENITSSDHALTQADMKYVAKKAKEYGIPVSFTRGKDKDNIYASVRSGDLPILQRICTDMMRDKLAERPQELGNFKVKEWEIPYITAELNKHDLAAQFGKTKDGECFCLYEKADEKAIMIARNEFVRKCEEVKKEFTFDRNEDGFFTIKDLHSGREISFDEPPTQEELSAMMQEQFGCDENKANIACAKFGEEMLQGEAKQKFFSTQPTDAFSEVKTNITVEGEDILTKPYTCLRVTPKSDGIPRIVYQDADGNFAVLNPEKMTQRQMAERLQTQLKITDAETLQALVSKAQKVSDYYASQEMQTLERTFTESDFDALELYKCEVEPYPLPDNPDITVTRKLPVNRVDNEIIRTDKDHFTVTSNATIIGTDQNDMEHTSIDTQQRVLSFSDKKNAIAELSAMYQQQGVPEHIAKQLAKDAFKQAKAQSAEKILVVEEAKAESATISHGAKKVEVPLGDPATAADTIHKEFDVSEETAVAIVAKAEDAVHPFDMEELIRETEEFYSAKENPEEGFHDAEHTELHTLDDVQTEKKLPLNDSDMQSTLALPDKPDVPAAKPELPSVPVGRR